MNMNMWYPYEYIECQYKYIESGIQKMGFEFSQVIQKKRKKSDKGCCNLHLEV